MKYVEDGIGGIAGLDFSEKWMGTEIFLGFLLVSFYSIVEDGLIIGR